MKLNSCLFLLLILVACKDDSYIAEGNYLNPPKDSVSFGYRITDLYFFDTARAETQISFKLDTGLGYFWSEINIHYKEKGLKRQYIPEYTSGRIAKLLDMSGAHENIEISYTKITSASSANFLSFIKYYREDSPFALQFVYDAKTYGLNYILKRYLYPDGSIGNVIEMKTFCPNADLGSCADTATTEYFQYGSDFNSLYNCNEIIPFMLILSKPQQQTLDDILPLLPYYFSKKLAVSSVKSNKGTFEYGLNKKEPTFLYFKPLNSTYPEGFNFSMRIY